MVGWILAIVAISLALWNDSLITTAAWSPASSFQPIRVPWAKSLSSSPGRRVYPETSLRHHDGTDHGEEVATTTATVAETWPAVPPERVIICPDAAAVGDQVRQILDTAAQEALAQKGHFCLAIPGGSILKMLVGSGPEDNAASSLASHWSAHTTLAYVNHKCVDMTDLDQATHAKASKLFLQTWSPEAHYILLQGTGDGPAEAAAYQAQLSACVQQGRLPVQTETGLPVFDLMLIGVGDDGHVGSLYPQRPEVMVGPEGPWVLSVDKKTPNSITLALPVMAAARQVVVAACGVSEKYPMGKSDAMRRALVDPQETLATFPAVGLRPVATYVLDTAAASQLGPDYS